MPTVRNIITKKKTKTIAMTIYGHGVPSNGPTLLVVGEEVWLSAEAVMTREAVECLTMVVSSVAREGKIHLLDGSETTSAIGRPQKNQFVATLQYCSIT